MKTGSKRGAALAYVIVVSAALMILASALVFSAKVNLDSATNSLESRQAYLDAKSAIEYGRAYVLQNPDAGSFTILKTSENSGFTIGSGENAVAEYDSTRKLIKASAKYRSSDRVRKLGYQFTTEENGGGGGSDLPYSFLIAGGSYYGENNQNILYDNSNGFYKGTKSDYPVVATHAIIFPIDHPEMTAPEVNFIGRKVEMGTVNCLFSNGSKNVTTITADFIGFDGDIVGKAHVQSDWPTTRLPEAPRLYIKSKTNSSSVVVRFSRDLMIEFIKDNNTILTDYIRAVPVQFEAGYYRFPNGTDLFDLENIKRKATKLTEDEVKEVLQQYQTARYTNADIPMLLSSETISSNPWTQQGKMQNPNPTPITTENATVFMCALLWDTKNQNAQYKAPNVVFQWNNRNNMTESQNDPMVITFQVKQISINLENIYGHPSFEKRNTNSHIYIQNTADESPIITFVTDTTIKTSKGTTTIDAGVYRISDDNRVGGTVNPFKIDLFDKDLELEKIADVGESGGSGGGGTEITGGVYTDGE
ncbi:MAG: hypothetical protein E7519_12475 [Ruminococcaceae bacterium]|nr:hypothetical protein [Oscillospiraceae bacterium]